MNETDPLEKLRDIHLPPPVADWPPAPGWWLLALLALLAICALVFWAWRRYRRRAWRREALAALPSPEQRSEADSPYYSELNQLLKRAARVRYPKAGTDRLSGGSWHAFLAAMAPALPGKDLLALVEAPFQPKAAISPECAHDLTRRWLRSQQC